MNLQPPCNDALLLTLTSDRCLNLFTIYVWNHIVNQNHTVNNAFWSYQRCDIHPVWLFKPIKILPPLFGKYITVLYYFCYFVYYIRVKPIAKLKKKILGIYMCTKFVLFYSWIDIGLTHAVAVINVTHAIILVWIPRAVPTYQQSGGWFGEKYTYF